MFGNLHKFPTCPEGVGLLLWVEDGPNTDLDVCATTDGARQSLLNPHTWKQADISGQLELNGSNAPEALSLYAAFNSLGNGF
jgi:hypothetical protein